MSDIPTQTPTPSLRQEEQKEWGEKIIQGERRGRRKMIETPHPFTTDAYALNLISPDLILPACQV